MKRRQFDWQLPDAIERRLGDTTYGRQRTIYEEDHLLIILHAPPGADDEQRVPEVFLRKPDGELLCNGQPNGDFRMRKLLAAYQKIFEELTEIYEQSSGKDTSELFALLEALAPLNRSSTNMAAALQSARELSKTDQFLIGMRDEAYELSRSIELLYTDTKAALDYRIACNAESQAKKAHEMATAQHKLNVMAAITFPLMAIAAILGMNLVHGFENGSPLVFYSVFIAGLIVGLIVKKWVTQNGD
ncbi:MAG: hypothetical protein JXM70_03225 [Pirellulales bacterium]|nr:hypothetical protein [Pirellulales bacterium]